MEIAICPLLQDAQLRSEGVTYTSLHWMSTGFELGQAPLTQFHV